MSHKRRKYTSEISKTQWKRLKWMLPKHKGAGHPQELDLRMVINAISIFWLLALLEVIVLAANSNDRIFIFG